MVGDFEYNCVKLGKDMRLRQKLVTKYRDGWLNSEMSGYCKQIYRCLTGEMDGYGCRQVQICFGYKRKMCLI